jgi:hypothetical protein
MTNKNGQAKYRVFDPKSGQMDFPMEVRIYQAIGEWVAGDTMTGAFDENWNSRSDVLLEFTNEYDKNGKPIYEGDILFKGNPEYFDRNSPGGWDITEDDRRLWGAGTAYVIKGKFSFHVVEIECGEWAFNGPEGREWMPYEVEVVGNIYQNPEMLKEIKI